MKNPVLAILSLVFIIAGNAYADDSMVEKLDALKEKLRSYWMDAPKPGFTQKIAIMRILRSHRNEIRTEARKLRENFIDMRREFRRCLTREQLLKVMDIQDELTMRLPGEKAAIMLAKLPKEERTKLLGLLREMWQGDAVTRPQTLEKLFLFADTVAHPIIVEELELTAEQQAELKRVVAQGRKKVREILPALLEKVSNVRNLVREKLTGEQKKFIESHRDKIFQHIVQFAESL